MLFVEDTKVLAAMQTGYLIRQFEEPMRPQFLFRSDYTAEPWNAPGVISIYKTRHGTMAPNLAPLPLGVDPQPGKFDFEQWLATISRHAQPIDGLITEARYSIAGYMATRLNVLATNAGQVLNRMARQGFYNSALAGQTVLDSTTGSSTTKHVRRINGFTVAFNANTRKFEAVSVSNPLTAYVRNGSAWDPVIITGCTPDASGDECGPGTLTLSTAYSHTKGQAIVAASASYIQRAGGGYSVDDVDSTDHLTVADLRGAVGRLKKMNVPRYPDGFYHAHLSTASANQIRGDQEFRDLYKTTGLERVKENPYFSSIITLLEGCILFENQECPDIDNVPATYGSDGGALAVETVNADGAGNPVEHVLVTGAGCGIEYRDQPLGLDPLLQGQANGRVGDWSILPNGIRAEIDGIQVTIRGPMNSELSDLRFTWSFYGGPSIGTDYLSMAPGSAYTGFNGRATYKRGVVIQHG